MDSPTTLDCLDIKAMLSALVDGQLDPPHRHEAERHLAACEACRRMLDDAERANDAIVAEARLIASDGLPEGFEGAVLSRTVYERGRRGVLESITTWGGWLAAAACVILALTIWSLDRRPAGRGVERAGDVAAAAESAFHGARLARSFTFGEDAEREGFARPDPAILVRRTPSVWDSISLVESPSITREDAETMYAAALLMEEVADLDPGDGARLERIRRIASYDDLIARLAAARSRLAVDQPVVFATESVLRSILHESTTPDDIAFLRDQAESLRLFDELHEISDRCGPGESA